MGGHLLEDVLVEEVRRRDRLVAIDDEAALICPWASRSPYEMRLLPRSVAPRFDRDDRGADAARPGAGRPSRRCSAWARSSTSGSGPPRAAASEFHWHLDIVPRLSLRAGFELGTGVDINSVAPEQAAAELREALPA